jgi:hypothetical protein
VGEALPLLGMFALVVWAWWRQDFPVTPARLREAREALADARRIEQRSAALAKLGKIQRDNAVFPTRDDDLSAVEPW